MTKGKGLGLGELGKKMLELGLGVVGITEKKIREITAELIKKGELTKEEAEKFIDKLLKKTEKERKDLEERLTGVIKKVIEKTPLATKSELDELRKKIEEIEKRLA